MTDRSTTSGITRRTVLRAGGGALALAALSPTGRLLASASAAGLRGPNSLPDPSRPAGEPDPSLPFDHVVIVMQENHSFDAYLGMLALRGQPHADGFSFDAGGRPTNSNPVKAGYVTVQHAPSLCQPSSGGASQSWNDTHREVDAGRMDGFARLGVESMLYWDEPDLPFYYSLAKTFCLANRWFCSAPCQTYPNRRFLMAGTASGTISTDTGNVMIYPANGTIWDRLSAHGLSWRDYFTDVPTSALIFPTVERYPENMAHITQFYADCAAGTLPAVCLVDSDIGIAQVVAGATVGNVPAFQGINDYVSTINEDEEGGDANISQGENFVSRAVNAVLSSPAWPRILLIWLYDEHGGYYDHVPPPAAIPPDTIPPALGPHDVPGAYDVYGPRVPAVVVSAHSRRNAVTNVVHDHTSILATIESKWNLPALTYRDANAATLNDFLDLNEPTFPEPPTLAAPSNVVVAQAECSTAPVEFTVHPVPPGPVAGSGSGAAPGLLMRFYGRRHRLNGPLVVLSTTGGTLAGLEIELRRGRDVVARAHVAHLTSARHRVVLRPVAGSAGLRRGGYTLEALARGKVLVRRRVRLG